MMDLASASGTSHGVKQMQVIGQDPRVEQGLGEVNKAGRIRVDATEKDALIEQSRAGPMQCPQGVADWDIAYLPGVIGMDNEGDG